jgi:hypothetical protein
MNVIIKQMQLFVHVKPATFIELLSDSIIDDTKLRNYSKYETYFKEKRIHIINSIDSLMSNENKQTNIKIIENHLEDTKIIKDQTKDKYPYLSLEEPTYCNFLDSYKIFTTFQFVNIIDFIIRHSNEYLDNFDLISETQKIDKFTFKVNFFELFFYWLTCPLNDNVSLVTCVRNDQISAARIKSFDKLKNEYIELSNKTNDPNAERTQKLLNRILKKMDENEIDMTSNHIQPKNPFIKSYIKNDNFSVRGIKMTMLSESKIEISINKKKPIILTFAQFNFSKVDNNKQEIPNESWNKLLDFCKSEISTKIGTTRTDVSRLNKRLQYEFGLTENFFRIEKKIEGYSIYKPIFTFKDRFYLK